MSNHTSVSDILLKVIKNEFHKKKKLRWSLEVDASMSIVICDYLWFFSIIYVGNFQIQRFSLVSLFDKIVRLSRNLAII